MGFKEFRSWVRQEPLPPFGSPTCPGSPTAPSLSLFKRGLREVSLMHSIYKQFFTTFPWYIIVRQQTESNNYEPLHLLVNYSYFPNSKRGNKVRLH